MSEFCICKPNQLPALKRKGLHKTKVLNKTIKVNVKYTNMSFLGVFKNIYTILSKNKIVVLLFLIGIILRFINLEQLTMFLSDQGRDAIIVKRIATLEDFPLIGAPTSIGQVFLGPFYYYLIAPFLLLFQFNPAGMSYGVAFLSILGIIMSFIFIKKEFGKITALFFILLAIFSFTQIEFARFSWNPNLLPIFGFITLYFFYKTLITHKHSYAFGFGACLALSLQLHYLASFLFVPIFIVLIESIIKNRSKFIIFKNISVSIVSFILFSSPLILFDLRHQFLNTKSFIKIFTQKDLISQSSYTSRFLETNQNFFNHVFKIDLNQYVALFILLIFAALYFLIKKKNKSGLFLKLNFYTVISYIVLFSFLTSARYPHYYASIYCSFFLVLAFMLGSLNKQAFFRYIVIPLFVVFYIILNAKNYYYFKKTDDWSQIKHSQTVANFLTDKIGNKPFNIATWPIAFGEDNYLYFVELKGHIPVDRSKVQITDQMFVLCNQDPCLVINSPSWNISMFGKAKIDKIWEIEGIKIYKLIHEK